MNIIIKYLKSHSMKLILQNRKEYTYENFGACEESQAGILNWEIRYWSLFCDMTVCGGYPE